MLWQFDILENLLLSHMERQDIPDNWGGGFFLFVGPRGTDHMVGNVSRSWLA